MRIALDVQGADNGLSTVVDGARTAAAEGIEIVLVGAQDEIAALGPFPGNISIVNATEVVTNHDDPATAVRRLKDSSIVVGAKLVASGEADALVSAGPTGAALAASLFNMKRIKGVKRPALAVILPDGRGGRSLLLDAGANVDVPAEMLVQFAHLGAQFCIRVLGIAEPRVGVLSIGEEGGKGNDRVVEATRLLSDPANSLHFNFLGNIEGRDITNGSADVIVTDGFTGNVALKAIEGAAKATMLAAVEAIKSNPVSKVGGLLAKRSLLKIRTEVDPNTTGGALLLGLRGVSVVAHGSSNAAGIAAAIRLAHRSAKGNVTGEIAAAIAELNEHQAAETAVTVASADDA
ncbi:MAG: phosphate acyltransferase PlsX [Thermoleophilaceae bacterium]|nr:phosphate acyltransferase PlsX [Thermoleophilaceae bacterium]